MWGTPVLSWFLTPMNTILISIMILSQQSSRLAKVESVPGAVDERPMPISWHVRSPSSQIVAGKSPNRQWRWFPINRGLPDHPF